MRIGILGAGHVGETVGRLWVEAGHQVLFGSRHPDESAGLVQAIGANASAGTPRQAALFGEVVLLAVPMKAIPELADSLAPVLANKIVLDASNPDPERDGEPAREAIRLGHGSSRWTASRLPGARLVKAFNMQRFDALRAEAHRNEDPLAIALAGDDFGALAVAEQLVRDAGFEAVIVGSLEEGRAFDPGTRHYAKSVRASHLRHELSEREAAARARDRLG
ncbi:MAG TPA: NADPH-dependent F420 reductase [Polyangiaceae bacterium]